MLLDYLPEIIGAVVSGAIGFAIRHYFIIRKQRNNFKKQFLNEKAEKEESTRMYQTLKGQFDLKFETILPFKENVKPFFGFTKPIISMMNYKGGVGKTTLTFHLAFYLSKIYNLRVLLVDLDAQGSLSLLTLGTGKNQWSNISKNKLCIEGIIRNLKESKNPKYDISKCIHKNVHFINKNRLPVSIIPQAGWDDLKLRVDDIHLTRWHMLNEFDVRLIWDNLAQIKDDFDVVIFDCPPDVGLLTQSAILYSNIILCPIVLDDFSYFGAETLELWLKEFSKISGVERKMDSFLVNRSRTYKDSIIENQLENLDNYKDFCKKKKVLLPPQETHINVSAKVFSKMLNGPIFGASGNLGEYEKSFTKMTEYIFSNFMENIK